jgi:hypothetical protein
MAGIPFPQGVAPGCANGWPFGPESIVLPRSSIQVRYFRMIQKSSHFRFTQFFIPHVPQIWIVISLNFRAGHNSSTAA